MQRLGHDRLTYSFYPLSLQEAGKLRESVDKKLTSLLLEISLRLPWHQYGDNGLMY